MCVAVLASGTGDQFRVTYVLQNLCSYYNFVILPLFALLGKYANDLQGIYLHFIQIKYFLTFLPLPNGNCMFRIQPYRQKKLASGTKTDRTNSFRMVASQYRQCLLVHCIPHMNTRCSSCINIRTSITYFISEST